MGLKGKFEMSGIEKDIIDVYVQDGLENAFKPSMNRTNQFMAEIGKREKQHRNFITETIGVTGTGKSYTDLSLCAILYPQFSLDTVYFTYREALSHKSEWEEGTAVDIDEKRHAELMGLGMFRVHSELEDLVQGIRKRRIHIVAASPERHQFQSTHFVFVTIPSQIDWENEIIRVAYCIPALFTNTLVCKGFLLFPHPRKLLGDDFIKRYERKKDKYLDIIQGRESGDYYTKLARDVIDKGELMKFLNKRKTAKGTIKAGKDGLVAWLSLEYVKENWNESEKYRIAELIRVLLIKEGIKIL